MGLVKKIEVVKRSEMSAHVANRRKIKNDFNENFEHDEGEPWLLSYADMVTLLMCFFILFFSLDRSKGAISDPERIKARLESMISVDVPRPSSSSKSESASKAAAQTRKDMSKALKEITKELSIIFTLTAPESDTLELTFLTVNFFKPGRAELTLEGEKAIDQVFAKIKKSAKGALLEVVGHTDSDKIVNSVYPSNWELSSNRASSVARVLIAKGFPAKDIKVVGHADTQPIAPETDSSGLIQYDAKKLNRRVVLRLTWKND